MKSPIHRLTRALDKVLYRPISTQNAREQAQRETALDVRRASTSIRPEKKLYYGLPRHR